MRQGGGEADEAGAGQMMQTRLMRQARGRTDEADEADEAGMW